MKRVLRSALLVLAMGMFAVSMSWAQIPRTISFQGVLADAQGVLLPDNTYTLTLSIYDQATGGTAIFSESQQVQVFRGVFNAIIGSTSPAGIPAGVDFNAQYWLGVQVNNGTELAPRTAFTSVPYALNAAVAQVAVRAFNADTAGYANRAGFADVATLADTAIDVRGGFVASVNGQQGALEILGAGSTTITRNGNQFIIRSTDTSGGGIRRIDNFDGSLVIDPPQGPFVTMFIREGGVQTYHLRDLSITTEKIADQAITNRKLAPNSVTTDKIVDGTIIEEDLADNSVTTRKIRDLNVWTQDINDLAVTNPKIGPDAVTTDKIMDGEVTTPDIRDLAVTNPKLGPNSVTTDKIMDAEVTTPDIRDLNVTNPKLGPNSVTTDKIMDGQVTTPDIADGAVTNPKLGPNSVTTDKIMDGQVTTPDLADGAVTNPKLGANAVTTDKIMDGQVTTPDLADGAVTNPKLGPNAVTTDKIMDGQVQTPDLADGAVTNPKLGPNAVTTDKIMDGQVQTPDLADGAVTNPKLGANAVTTDKILDGQVQTADILDGTILTEDIGNNQVPAAKMTTGGAALGTFLQSDGSATPIWSTNGQYITNINATNISHGTLADARLSSNVPLKNTLNVFTQLNSFNNGLTIARNGAIAMDVWTDFTGIGNQQAQFRWTDLGMPEMSTKIGGKRYGAAFDWIAMNYGGSKLFGIRSEWTPTLWYTAMDVNVDTAIFNSAVVFNGPIVWNGPLDITGRPSYIGDNTNNLQLTVRGPGAGATVDQFVVNGRANVAGRMTAGSFWGDGANLTSLNATNITSGTLSDVRLSSNVPLKNAANTFTATNTFNTGGVVINRSVNGQKALDVYTDYNTIDGPQATFRWIDAGYPEMGTQIGGKVTGGVFDWFKAYFGANNVMHLRSNWNPALGFHEVLNVNTDSSIFTGITRFDGPVIAASLSATTLSGDGSAITNLNASNIASGTLADTRLSSNVGLKNGANIWTGTNTYQAATTFNNTVNGAAFNGTSFNGAHTGDGSGLTSLNATSITSGTLADARLSTNVALKNAANVFTQLNTFNSGAAVARNGAVALDVYTDFTGVGSQQTQFRWDDLGMQPMSTKIGGKRYGAAFDWIAMNYGATKLFGVRSEWTPTLWYTAVDMTVDSVIVTGAARITGNVTIGGTLASASFSGSGAGLTNLNATQLTTGTVPGARLAGAYGNAVTFSNASNSFTGNGAGLTSLDADNISSGTLDLARIDAAGATAGQAITYDGANVVWATPIASALAMPFAQTVDEATTMFALTNTNAAAGNVASFANSSATNTGSALVVQNAGTGSAATIANTNGGATSAALSVSTMSTAVGGSAALFNGPLGAVAPTVAAVSWAANQAVYANAAGSGAAIYGYASGSGNGVAAVATSGVGLTATSNTNTAASVTITNAANSSAALQVSTLGAGAGVSASATSGAALAGTSSGGAGVNGTSTSGAGVAGTSTSGAGVNGYSTNGTGVVASSTNGTGLSATTGASAQYAGSFTGSVAGANGIQITAGTGGTAINVTNGAFIGSYTTVSNGGTIPNDAMVVYVNWTGAAADASLPTVALPTGVNGQTIIVATDDPDGANVGADTIWPGRGFRFTKLNGTWFREF